jgi:hypothetical protein
MATAAVYLSTDQVGRRGFNFMSIVIGPIRKSVSNSALSFRMEREEA